MNHLPFAILLFLLANVTTTFGQRPPSIGGGSGGGFGSFGNTGRGGGGGNVGEVTLDTSDIFYFFADNPNLIFPFEDSLLGHFQQYDPARQQMYDYGHLGNLGSAARPLFYQPSFRQGFDVGLHQFDMYQIKTSDVRFYKIEQAYTQAGHSQGQTQSDAFTNVRFSRNFANGINFSLEYRKIDNAGAYDNQKAKNSDVAAGLWFHNKYDTYDGFFTLVNNSVEQQDNGGIAEGADTVYEDAFRLDVNLLNSNTRHANREYAYTQYFYLNKILSQDNIDRRTAARKARKEEKEKKKAERRLAKLAARDSTLRDTLTKDSTLVLPDSLQSISPKDSLSQNAPAHRPRDGHQQADHPSRVHLREFSEHNLRHWMSRKAGYSPFTTKQPGEQTVINFLHCRQTPCTSATFGWTTAGCGISWKSKNCKTPLNFKPLNCEKPPPTPQAVRYLPKGTSWK